MKDDGNPVVPVGSSDLHLAAHLFQPPRLTLAREMRGLTKAELAERIGKSAAAVGQFESGGRAACRPDPRTLAALALSLGVPVGFFARRSAVPHLAVDTCHFRSMRSTSQRERRQLLARGSLICDLLRELENHVRFPEEQVSRVARPLRNEADIDQLAIEVRQAWGLGLGPISNVVNLLERQGVVVTQVPASSMDVDAFSAWHDGRPLAFLVMAKGSTSRVRWDASHELGHLVMHMDVVPGSPIAEREADRFAAAFLLPRDAFLPECPRRLNWDHFYELKRRWKVSVSALVKRAYDLHCITEATYRRAFIHLNKSGERHAERDEPPPEPPTLIASAIAAAATRIDKASIAHGLGLSLGDLEALVSPESAGDASGPFPHSASNRSMLPPTNSINDIYTSDVLMRIKAKDSGIGAVNNLPIRLRYLIFSQEELPFRTLYARRKIWREYISYAAQVGFLDTDVRERLASDNEDTFRGAIAECMSLWFFANKLQIRLQRMVAQSGPRADFKAEGPMHVEIKARHVPLHGDIVGGDDSEELRKTVSSAGKQFSSGIPNLLVIVSSLRTPISLDRDQLEKALIGEMAWSVPVSINGDEPTREVSEIFIVNGKLAKVFRRQDGLLKPDFTRISAVATLEEDVVYENDAYEIVHRFHVVHNPYSTQPIRSGTFSPYPEMAANNDVMTWNDLQE